jgi:myo-inositol-1(or 4)-monophosphatase
MHPMLNIAVKAARRAASVIQRASNNLDVIPVQRKQQNDFVSEVDRNAEAALIEVVMDAYPDHGILTEERGELGNPDSDFRWIIDPLDGTTNFLHGFGQYAVSIGIEHRGQMTHGVIYDPNRNELFTTSKGAGAYLNDRRIRVTRRTQLEGALLTTGFPYRAFDHVDEYLALLKAFSQQAAGIRRPGSAALDLAYVACGRFDGFWEYGLMPWDIAAGTLLVQEAGGLVTDLQGESDYMISGNVLAGTPKILGQMLQVIHAVRNPD